MPIRTIKDLYPELSAREVETLLSDCNYGHSVALLEKEITEYLTRRTTENFSSCLEDVRDLESLFECEPVPFFAATWEVSELPLRRLKAIVDSFPCILAKNTVVKSFVSMLCSELQRILLRAQLAFVERNIDDTEDDQGYEEIANKLFERNIEFSASYPIAGYLAKKIACKHLAYLREVLEHLVQDWVALSHLGIREGSKVVNVRLNLGDSHAGKSVALVEFDEGQRILHKPRSLKAEKACMNFSRELGKKLGFTCTFVCEVIDREQYGWAQYVSHDEKAKFKNPRAIAEFACLLKLLCFSDVHYENVRFSPSGEPILVDAETVLSAGLHSISASVDPTHITLAEVITSTGLFPSPLVIPKKKGETFVDIGVLGRRGHGSVKERQLVIKDPFTTKMRIVYEDVAKHIPRNELSSPVTDDFVKNVCSRYVELLTLVIDHKKEISKFFSKCFVGVHVRVVLQDTLRYANAIQLATNQECLQTASFFIGALLRTFLKRPDLDRQVLIYESETLIESDIPRYVTPVNSRSITASNQCLVASYFFEPPLKCALAKLNKLTRLSVDLDAWLITITFAPYYTEKANRTAFQICSREGTDQAGILRSTCLALNRLTLGYVPPQDSMPASWLGARLSSHAHQYWYVDELALDLYAGSVGVAFPLVLAESLGIPIEGTGYAKTFLQSLLERLEELDLHALAKLECGALSGAHSVLWVLDRCGQIRRDTDLLNRVHDLAVKMLRVPDAIGHDYLSGIAGLAVLACRLGVFEASEFKERYLRFLQQIANRQLPSEWLSGYAHGYAGLLGSASVVGGSIPEASQLAQPVDRLFSIVLQIRDKKSGLWPIGANQDNVGRGWCSGSSGILLALTQLHSSPYGNEYNLLPLIERLTEDVTRNSFGGNPTLCHGDIGNLWILEHVGNLLNDQALVEKTRNAGMTWLKDVFPVYLDSLSRSAVSHSLFAGIAGPCLYAEHFMSRDNIVRSPLWLG